MDINYSHKYIPGVIQENIQENGMRRDIAARDRIAHEFQTPLAILMGNLELLENEEGIHNRRALCVMHTTIERLSRLVSRTLERARDKERHPNQELVSVSILLEDAHDECIVLAEARGIKVLFVQSVRDFCRGNYDELKEVLLNLISNALQHTQSGGTVALSACLSNGQIEIEVADTGEGISVEHLPHVFERFYRIGECRAGALGDHDRRGTGLGLFICREIITAHQGTIEVTSELGKGSRFKIRLPAAVDG